MLDRTTRYLDTLIHKHQSVLDAAVEQFGQPLHIFFAEEMNRQVDEYKAIRDALYPSLNIAFAIKSNPCRGAVRAASRLGMGADCASEYELQAALEEGISPSRITCNGNAKSDHYLELALRHEALIVVDNQDELNALSRICLACDKQANILIRFRGMPLAGLTAADQSTAADWTKFGFHIDEAKALFEHISASAEFHFLGIGAHIGTQLSKPQGFTRLFECLLSLVALACTQHLTLSILNIGGGFPVNFIDSDNAQQFQNRLYYQLTGKANDAGSVTWNGLAYGYGHVKSEECPQRWQGKAYWTDYPGASMLGHILQEPMANGITPLQALVDLGSPQLIVEPGRSITAPSGITMCDVMGRKSVMEHELIMLDLGINNHSTNLIAPDMFPVKVLPVKQTDTPHEAFLAGRLCFTGDMISKNKVIVNRLPERGERMVIYHTGGYSADHFASHSCGFPKPAKVAILADGSIEVWRARESFVDVFGAPDCSLLPADLPSTDAKETNRI